MMDRVYNKNVRNAKQLQVFDDTKKNGDMIQDYRYGLQDEQPPTSSFKSTLKTVSIDECK